MYVSTIQIQKEQIRCLCAYIVVWMYEEAVKVKGFAKKGVIIATTQYLEPACPTQASSPDTVCQLEAPCQQVRYLFTGLRRL
jgi:hypothetical protein